MQSEYDGVKYYSKSDMSVGCELEKAEPIIVAASKGKSFESINEILELYNIQELMDTDIRLLKWSEETYRDLKGKAKPFISIIAKFYSQICDENFVELVQNVAIGYMDDFWELFVRFKVYQRISPNTFAEYLKKPDTVLYQILEYKDIVRAYDIPLANELRTSKQTCRILVAKFLEKSDIAYFLPTSFKPEEFESVFQNYIDSDYVNPNILQLIFDAQSTGECPISDTIRCNAKHRFHDFWQTSGENAIRTESGIRISFTNQEELKKFTTEGLSYLISYDVKWLEENLDYPTILNNFFYMFEMFDICWRSTLVSVKSQISAIESVFAPKGVKFYPQGKRFSINAMTSSAQMAMYYDFLKAHDIDLENIFVWFFTEYLKNEFHAEGFFMKASSATNYVEKCRTLASEMEGILKQYRMYVRDGRIDRELFEMSSEHLVIDGMPSQISDKYVYACGTDIQNEMFVMFSDQSTLSYTEKTKTKYSTLFELLKNETMTIGDFASHQKTTLNWLIDRHALIFNESGKVCLNRNRVGLLKDLYDHDVVCVHHLGKWVSALQELYETGDIRIESTLFSIPERDFLNYELTKAEYSDGLDLRNKYAHSTYPQDENIQRQDYIELLKIMILIITKINEEFCLLNDLKEVPI